jgi:monoamine oxidase
MVRYRWMDEHPPTDATELDFFRFPGDRLAGRTQPARPKRVCVIGAGIAGLVAAYELQKAGHTVVLVERLAHVGGRIRTWHVGSVSGEFGPMRIPPCHQGTMHYVNELGLDTGLFISHNADGWLLLRGKKERYANWLSFIPEFGGDPRHLFPGFPFHKTQSDPRQIHSKVLALAKATLSRGELWSIFNGSLGPAARALGSITLWQLAEGLFDDLTGWAGPFAGTIPGAPKRSSTRPPLRSFSPAGWEFVGRATGALWEERISALEAFIEDVWVSGAGRKRLTDGMDALPLKLKQRISSLGADVRLGIKVTRVVVEGMDDRVRVFSSDNEEVLADGRAFDYVICAAPASATSRIEFDPPLSAQKYEALTNVTYMSAAKTLVLVRRRRWEIDDKIFGGASFTDLPIQQCWYPPDNAKPDPEPDDPLRPTPPQGIGVGPQVDTDPERFVALSEEVSHNPAILTGAYMTGINAERFTSLSDQERTDEALRYLERLHPGIRGDVECVKHCCWIEERTPGGGAWTYFGTGAHERYQDALCEPHPTPDEPRVFFAGEHLCVLHGWMQSAIQSSLEATIALMDAP